MAEWVNISNLKVTDHFYLPEILPATPKRNHRPLLHSVAPTTVNLLNSGTGRTRTELLGIGRVADEWHT